MERVEKVGNILNFVIGYYRLTSTIARLDAEARDKIKTLIDISKWTVQKFSQVKSNIDKTHRQLNRACKHEEEILMQNIQSLVLTSSRKKYINSESGGDKLLSLDTEKTHLIFTLTQSLQFLSFWSLIPDLIRLFLKTPDLSIMARSQ
jgi:hypothetical protein